MSTKAFLIVLVAVAALVLGAICMHTSAGHELMRAVHGDRR